MKNTVVVRKCKSHRVAIGVFSILAVVIITFCVLSFGVLEAILLYVPVLLIVTPMMLYYSTWQLRFEEKAIVKRLFFREVSRCSYVQLREVKKRYYVSERDYCVVMCFTDGKKFQFRMDDEGALQAVKTLQRHCSIKTI